MAQKRTKIGQKLVFLKYCHIVYRWKAYEEVNTNFVKKIKFFIFGPKMVQKGPKNGQKCDFLKYSRIIHTLIHTLHTPHMHAHAHTNVHAYKISYCITFDRPA